MANVLVHGVHVSNEGELRASEASLCVRGVPEMLSGHGPLPNTDETRRWTVTIGGASVEFVLSWDEWMEDTSKREELAGHVYVKLDEPLGLDEWTERWFRPLQHLVGCVTRGLAQFESVELVLRAHGVAAELHPAIRVAGSDEFWERRDIAVLRHQRPTTDIRERAPDGALICPDDGGFEAFVAGFLDLHVRLGRSAPFLFQALSAPSGFLETQLLSMTSAAEAFHRTQHPERPLPDDTHEQLKQRLLDCLDDERQRNVYRSPIHYANAPSQRKRFKALVSQTASVLPELAEPAKTMADKLADTRDSFTHLDEEGPAAVEGERLLRLLRRLRIVMELHVLLASGVGEAVAASLLRRAYTTKGGLG